MLTDAECRNATCPPDRKQARLSDAKGLYLQVSPKGSRRWFWKYRMAGVEKQLALGSYPDVTLRAAREARDGAKLQKSEGHDPVQARKVAKLKAAAMGANRFAEVARDWYGNHLANWSAGHAIREKRNIDKDLIPYFGARRIAEIEPIELLAALRKVEERGASSIPSRVLITAHGIWRFAVATARAPRDITPDLKGALKPHTKTHFAAITDPVELGALLRVIRGYQGGPIVRAALQLTPILFQRPNELRGMTWAEIDFDRALWTIPSARMKRSVSDKLNGQPHLVPLPRQAVEILRSLQILTGHGSMVFPGERSHERPISDNALRAALQTMGIGSDVQTIHGFRATALTMASEQLDLDPNVIDAQLAHAVKDVNGRAYNRTQYLKHRADMMQKWADYLDKLAAGADVLNLRAAA